MSDLGIPPFGGGGTVWNLKGEDIQKQRDFSAFIMMLRIFLSPYYFMSVLLELNRCEKEC